MNTIEKIRTDKSITNQLTGKQSKQIKEYKIISGKKTYTVSREQVELFYRLYTKNGANLTLAEISSSYFPGYLDSDLAIIRDTFRKYEKLTKSSDIFAPHEYEEYNSDERDYRKKEFLLNIQKLKDKNNQISIYKKVIIEQQNTISDKIKLEKSVIDAIKNYKHTPFIVTPSNNKKSLCIWLSDMHIGCRVDEDRATMNENIGWNNKMVIARLNKVIDRVKSLGKFNEIWVFNLGDAIDGISGKTTRGNVILPQNMGDQEMVKNYIQDILYLFDNLYLNDCATKYYFRSVGESNHGGPTEYAASLALAAVLANKGVNCEVVSKTFGIETICDSTVIYMHGKDSLTQKVPFGVVLDGKTKEYLDAFISTNDLNSKRGNIIFVKGDSHQAALTATNDYEYKAVGSLFGSSSWAQANFPSRGWEVNMSIFEPENYRMDFCVK